MIYDPNEPHVRCGTGVAGWTQDPNLGLAPRGPHDHQPTKFGPMPSAKLVMKQVHSLAGRIEILNQLVREGTKDPRMRQLAVSLVNGCPDRSDGCEVATIFWFVKANVRYTGDIQDIDTYQSGARTLQFGGGDCDDHSTLLATLLSILGFQTGFRVISTTGQMWEHIYALVGLPRLRPSGVLPLDTTVPSSFPGWEPSKAQIKAAKDFYPIRMVG